MNIVFFGSSNYCLPVLETLNENFHIKGLFTRRGTLPKQFALSHNIRDFSPGNEEELLELKEKISHPQPDLGVVADFGIIIPKEIFTLPRFKTLNIHFSKLPKLRGPSPVQYTILNGEKSAFVSIIIMDEKVDTGDIIWQKEVSLDGNETTDTLYKKLFNITAVELPNVISLFVKNKINLIKQDHSQATYTKRLTREDGFIPFSLLDLAMKGIKLTKDQLCQWTRLKNYQLPITNYQLPIFIERAVRAFTPWPGVWTKINIKNHPPAGGSNIKYEEKRLKILKAHPEKDKLVLDQVQLEGKNPVTWKQFIQGYPRYSFNNPC